MIFIYIFYLHKFANIKSQKFFHNFNLFLSASPKKKVKTEGNPVEIFFYSPSTILKNIRSSH